MRHLEDSTIRVPMVILVATKAGVSPLAATAGSPLTKMAGHLTFPDLAGVVASHTEGITDGLPAAGPPV